MLPSTDWIQCVFQKSPLSQWDVCNFFKKILSGFFASKQFRISRFVPQFPSYKVQSSNSTQPSIPSEVSSRIIHGMSLDFKPFPLFEAFFTDANVCNFGTWDTTYFGVVSLCISFTNSEVVGIFLFCWGLCIHHWCIFHVITRLCYFIFHDLHQHLPNLMGQMSRFSFFTFWSWLVCSCFLLWHL